MNHFLNKFSIPFNQIYKKIILIFFIIFCTGCSSKQNNSYYSKSNNTSINSTNNYYKKIKIYEYINFNRFNNNRKLKMQKLLQNNIIYFDEYQYDIHSDYYKILDYHVKFLLKYPKSIVKIEGHSDERGTPEYNIALGENRANSLKRYFKNKGVSEEQIIIVSYGKEKPEIFGHDETAYSKNRRVVLIY